MKICFASSSGGHLNQIKELDGKLKCESYFFVTSKDKFSESILKNKKKYFITDPKRNIIKLIINKLQTIKILMIEKPDIIISTGSGTAFWMCFLGRILGKKVLFIESIARVTKPSLFGKIVNKFANTTIYQWKPLGKYYKKGIYGGIIFDISFSPKSLKNKNIFLTVGSSDYKFNRLIEWADDLAKTKNYEIFGQIGTSSYIPQHFKYKEFLSTEEMKKQLKKCSIVLTHGGSGSIFNSIHEKKLVIVIPRLKKCGEHVDNHQLELANRISDLHVIKIAKTKKNIIDFIENKSKIRKSFHTQSKLPNILLKQVSKNV